MAKILVVDDEEALAKTVSKRLEMRGHESSYVFSGREAQEFIRKNQIDLLVTDIKMPGYSGLELLEWAKNEDPQVPVILISGFTDCTIDDAVKAGAVTILQKPFNSSELLELIEQTLRGVA